MNLGNMEQRTEGMKRQAQELIDQAYQKGYKAGQELREVITFEKECELIEQGRNEAWDCVRKIAVMPTETTEPMFNQFGLHNIMDHYSASEAIEKLKAWEQRIDNEIHVGDEVYFGNNSPFVVISIYIHAKERWVNGIGSDGSLYIHQMSKLKKTGKHHDEIVRLLEKMKEGEDGKG